MPTWAPSRCSTAAPWTSSSDGSFTITVDSEPAGGRPNHVQSTPEAHEFYIRDVLLQLGPRRPESPYGATAWRSTDGTGADARRAGRRHRGDDGLLRQLHRQAQPRRLQDGAQQVQPRLVGRQGRRHAQPGVRDGPVRPRARRGLRRRRRRWRRRVLHRAAEQHLGHHTGHRRPHRQPQQGPVRRPTRTAPTPTSSPPPIPASPTGSTPTGSARAS